MDFRFDRKTDKEALAKIMKEANADIFGVQEIVNFADFEIFVKENFPTYKLLLTNCGGAGRQRLGYLYNTKTILLDNFFQDETITLSSKKCTQGIRPAAIGHFKTVQDQFPFTIINVHLKAGDKPANEETRIQQYSVIGEYIQKFENEGRKNILVMGDFNSTDYIKRNENYQTFLDFTSRFELYNYADEVECTAYWNGGKSNGIDHPAIIDHILATQNFYNNFKSHSVESLAHCKASKCEISKREDLGISYSNVSDHCPLSTTLK
jgi:endonuclease/exonuclease/phosphatase family metal-dependent hydrolase